MSRATSTACRFASCSTAAIEFGFGLLRRQAGHPLKCRLVLAGGIGQLLSLRFEISLQLIELPGALLERPNIGVEPLLAVAQALLAALQIRPLFPHLGASSSCLLLGLRSSVLCRRHQGRRSSIEVIGQPVGGYPRPFVDRNRLFELHPRRPGGAVVTDEVGDPGATFEDGERRQML